MSEEQQEEFIEAPEVEVEVEAAPAPPEPEIDSETIEEAKKYGWRAKEEFDLAPEGWVDADRFMELPATQRKVLKDQNKTLNERIQSLEGQNASVAREAARATKLAMEEQKRAHEAQLNDLRNQQRKAAELGDMAEYDRLNVERQKVAESQPAQQPQQPEHSPEYQAHHSSAEWAKDPILWKFAIDAVNQGGPTVMGMRDIDQLKYAEAKVREYFPQKFEAPKPPSPPKVDGGGIGGGAAPKKGVNALPADARRAGKEFVEAGVFKDMEAYAKAYFEGDE